MPTSKMSPVSAAMISSPKEKFFKESASFLKKRSKKLLSVG
jgi:hypothetical protein